MKTTFAALLAAAAVTSAGAASAQPFPWPFGPSQQPSYGADRGGPSITFYEGENFRGRAVTVFGEENNLNDLSFNDRARSARTNGAFVVCEDADFRGRCERIAGAISDLGRIGLTGRISSARDARFGGGYDGGAEGGYGGGYEGGYGGGYGGGGYGYEDRPRGAGYGNPRRDGVQGRSVTFFARPNVGGSDLAARGQAAADQFCRASGLGSAVYYGQGERSRRAVDTDGRLVDAPVLRDVLCRNR